VAEPISLTAWPELSLWLCPLCEAPPDTDLTVLDHDERERAARFVHEVHRRRHLAAHVAVRLLLSRVTGERAERLQFAADGNGKPQLVHPAGWHHNLSHSEEWAVVGAQRAAPMGVDVEALRSVEDAMALARRHYTPAERAAVEQAVDERARDAAFLRVWTRKEACLKAVGLGLRLAPSSFEAGAGVGVAVTHLKTPAGVAAVEVQSVQADGRPVVIAAARVVGLASI
jgi:4'-phosphopantetheinyl transferase